MKQRRRRHRSNVLFVTRDAGLYAALKVAFRRHIDVEALPTPAAALSQVTMRPPTLILLDVHEPDPETHLLLTRASMVVPPCRVVVIVSAAQSETLRTLATLPISGVIQRPVLFVELQRLFTALCALRMLNGHARVAPFGKYVAKVFEVLASEYRDGLTRVALARAVYLSPSHLAFKVRHETGMTLTECLTRIRIEVVKFHLTQSDAKLQAISHDTGFCDASHLARVFQRYGYPSPTAYRQQHTSSRPVALRRASA